MHLTATPLPWRPRAKRVVMFLPLYLPPSLPPYLPPSLPLLKGSLIFIFIFLKWSSGGIKLFKFGKFWISVFTIGKKSNFVPKIGGFGRQKRFSDLAENWLIWGSDDIKLFKFGKFWIPFFLNGKKSDLSFSRYWRFPAKKNYRGNSQINFVTKKGSLILLKLGSSIVPLKLIF